jgi:chemotaxis-related protein WspD
MARSDVTTNCWNGIGVHGDRSCPELVAHVHCHNCPAYSAGAQALLDRDLSDREIAERTAYFARPKPTGDASGESVVIFRVAGEWLALPTAAVEEIIDRRPIHSIPHRRRGAVLGIANVRGELVACVSLDHVLAIERQSGAGQQTTGRPHERLLVLRRGTIRAVCPVDDVHGIQRIPDADLRPLPTTLGRAATHHARAVLAWRGRSVGVLDAERLMETLQRSLS